MDTRGCPSLTVVLCLLAAMTAVGCGAPEAHRFSVTTADGVEVALTTGGPRYDGELFRYQQTLVIRPDPAVEESVMYSPYWMAMAADGRIFVGDMGDRRVVVFDGEGNYLYRFGREGQGPGEFQSVGFVDVVGDRLWVTDRYRNHEFELDGTFVATHTLPLEARNLVRDGRWWRLADGRYVIFNLSRRSERYTESRAEMHVVGPDGEARVSNVTPWVPNGEYLEQGDGGRPVWLQHYFAGRPWGDYSREHGFFLTNPPEPEVLVYDDEGTLRRRLRIDIAPEPVTDADRQWVLSRLEEGIRRAQDGAFESNVDMARIQRANPRYADPKHYWERPIVDDQGFVWLLVPDAPGVPDGSYRFRLLSPEGEYLGETTTPGWPQPQRGHLLARWEDPDSGEVFPAIYRVIPVVEGLAY